MTEPDPATRDAVSDAYRREWAQVLATTVRVAGDLDLAEECVQEAFLSALTEWDAKGVPANPGAWLTTVAKRKALDQLRRASTARAKLPLLVEPEGTEGEVAEETTAIPDDRLRLVFTCCHPALAPETQVALTLRLVCGLPTAVVAKTFLVSESTMAARITRGKKKIQIASIPYAMPKQDELSARLDTVLTVIYLFFTAGHTRSSGETLIDDTVVASSIDLARMLYRLMPNAGEVQGLLALLLLTDARRGSRVGPDGRLVLLAEQDRSGWDRGAIVEGLQLVRSARQTAPEGRFVLQAAIAAVHAQAETAADTDWPEIARLYTELLRVWGSPVVALNRAVSVAEVEGAEAALAIVDELVDAGEVARYPYLWSTRAELLRRMNRDEDAGESYRQALLLVQNDVERAFLQERLRSLRW
ncbi:MAG: RNA polymerase sigma factor [Actinomycetes bacterium]